MESLEGKREVYSHEWFKKRAFDSLIKRPDDIWDFSDSLLLYLPDSEGVYEDIQQTETPYHKLVTAPERAYLKTIAPSVVEHLPDLFTYVDLGPGTEHKEQFFFDAAKQYGKQFTYVPVDISSKFLQLASDYAARQGIASSPVRAAFEDAVNFIDSKSPSRFVSLGLTYSNYEPRIILDLLKTLAGPSGFAFINAQLRDRVDMQGIKDLYADVVNIARAKLRLIGLDAGSVSNLHTDDGIRGWCTVTSPTPALEEKGIRSGDELLIFQSLRPTRESLEHDIAEVFDTYELFDTGESFVSALLKNKNQD